jgi:hypothetical protein
MNYWYASLDTEIFIDMDNPEKSWNHFHARLNGAIESKILEITDVHAYASSNGKHRHFIIVLRHNLDAVSRCCYAIAFHSDIYRGICSIMRAQHGVPAPDILISRSPYYRLADATCECKGKHTREIMLKCPAAIKLRGEFRCVGFFGKPSKIPISNGVTGKTMNGTMIHFSDTKAVVKSK